MDWLAAGKTGHKPPSWLACTFSMQGPLNPDAFLRMIRTWVDRHENLRSYLISSGYPLRRLTLAQGNVKAEAVETGTFTDVKLLMSRLEELFDEEVSPLSWPGYLIATISRADEITVCVALDHSLTDAFSLLDISHEFQVIYEAAMASPDTTKPDSVLPPVSSYPDFAEQERATAEAVLPQNDAVVRWQKFITESGGQLPVFPVSLGKKGYHQEFQPGGYSRLLDAESAYAFEKICRSAGGNVFSGILTCVAGVINQITGTRDFRTMVPFHTHKAYRKPSMGWYVGMAPVAFNIDYSLPFTQAITSAVSGLNGVRDMARIPITRVAELIGQPLRDPFMISFMDLRRVDGSRAWAERRVALLRGRSTDPDEVCFWFFLTHEGLDVSYRCPHTGEAVTVMENFSEKIRSTLQSLIYEIL
ncbi:condensation domain-containing protein [Pantoea vagans]|uniref:condensation domain-containing protein n=1 Tax=Pantoea vagans TaxID=470934 RepID=UPI00301B47AB